MVRCIAILAEIRQWIDHQRVVQTVKEWTIHEFMDAGDNEIVTWTFAAVGQEAVVFDGVSIIHFNQINQIDLVREFEAQHQRRFPYHAQS